jgi:hypothetical protein
LRELSPQRRKEREEKQKNKRNSRQKNLQCTEAAFIASIDDPGFERHERFFPVVPVSFAFFASLR